jgi:hypothetical protein
MYKIPGKSVGRRDYCHFSQRFVRPEFYSKVLGNLRGNEGDVEFSYLAVQRGVSRGDALSGEEAVNRAFDGYETSDIQPDMLSLPRIILPPLKRKGHITLDLCTPQGRLERWTVPKSLSKLAHHDARKSRWGDLWAMGAKTRVPRSVKAGNGPDDGGRRSADGKKKKPRIVDITAGPDGSTISEKNAPLQRRSKGRKQEARDLMQEMLAEEEEEEEREIEEEIREDLEMAMRETEEQDPRTRR